MGCQSSIEEVNRCRGDLQVSINKLGSRIDALSTTLSQLQHDLAAHTSQSHTQPTPDPSTAENFKALTSKYNSLASLIEELKSSQHVLSASISELASSKASSSKHRSHEAELLLCIERLIDLSASSLTAENLLAEFETLTGIHLESISQLYHAVKHSSNLVKNPFGADGANDWHIHAGGDGVITEDFLTFKEKPHTFVTSYNWSTLEQNITVPAGNGERLLVVGAACGRREDCGAEAKIVANISGEELEVEKGLAGGQWEVLKVAKRIGKEEIEIVAKFMGKDTQYWAGHFGARFGYCFAVCFDL